MSTEAATFYESSAAEATTVRCAHCALPVPAGLVEPAAEHQFCCPGCRAVFATIHACGLDSYYRLRDAADATLRPAAPGIEGAFDVFDTTAFEGLYVTSDPGGTKSIDLILEGVTCAACVWLVERLPRVLGGVVEARLSLREATVRVTWDPTRLKLSRIARTLDGFGYTPHPAKGQSRKELLRKDERRRLVHLGAAGALMGNTMLLAFALYAGDAAGMASSYRGLFRWLSAALGVVCLAWPGAVFFRSSWAAIRTRTINLDVPITLALLAAGIPGTINVILGRGEIYFDSLTALIFLLLVGRWMQYRQQRRADAAVELLFSLTPATCHLVDGDRVIDAPVEALKAGDEVEVRSGDLIPADGVVRSGHSAVNQALLTGESVPAEVAPGDEVNAGAQNVGSVLRVRVTKVGQDTRVGRLMGLVERGLADKPAIVQFTDKVGTWFTATVSIGAAAVFAYWAWRAGVTPAIDHAVAFLIVTCPCVLGLATPLTLALAIGRLARADILVKSGAALERLSTSGGRLLLDKTGTLTQGALELVEWYGDPAVRPAVAAVERTSTHPIGRALVAALADEVGDEEPTDVVERHDGGLRARYLGRSLLIGSPTFLAREGATVSPDLRERRLALEESGATVVLVAVDRRCVALAALRDRVWDDSRSALEKMKRFGWRPAILSGDAAPVVRSVAAQVGVAVVDAAGQVSPEDKLAAVRESGMQSDGVTIMVGDGVNDAAALAAADVGIAVHGGAEASLAAADVYIARPGLGPLVHLVETGRHAMRVIRRNLLVSLGYNILAGTLAATGLMTPLLAAIIMPISSATVLSSAALAMTRRKGDTSWK